MLHIIPFWFDGEDVKRTAHHLRTRQSRPVAFDVFLHEVLEQCEFAWRRTNHFLAGLFRMDRLDKANTGGIYNLFHRFESHFDSTMTSVTPPSRSKVVPIRRLSPDAISAPKWASRKLAGIMPASVATAKRQ